VRERKEAVMGDYKFDTFYYSEDKSNEHYLTEIENLSDEEFNKMYRGRMHCPWCKGPQLALVKNEDKAFLRTYPKQSHLIIDEEICPYECDTASKRMVEEYIQELREKKKIKSLLEATMRRLFKQAVPQDETVNGVVTREKNPLLIEKIQDDKTIKRNIIPHYSFKSWGKNIPEEQLLVVYGKVHIELKEIKKVDKEGKEVTQVYIHFKDIKSQKLVTSCIKPRGMEVTEGDYCVVVLGTCHRKKSKDHTYYNLWLNTPVEESILIEAFSK